MLHFAACSRFGNNTRESNIYPTEFSWICGNPSAKEAKQSLWNYIEEWGKMLKKNLIYQQFINRMKKIKK